MGGTGNLLFTSIACTAGAAFDDVVVGFFLTFFLHTHIFLKARCAALSGIARVVVVS